MHLLEVELVRDGGVEVRGVGQQPLPLLGGVGGGRLQRGGELSERGVASRDLHLRDGAERHLVEVDVHFLERLYKGRGGREVE